MPNPAGKVCCERERERERERESQVYASVNVKMETLMEMPNAVETLEARAK